MTAKRENYDPETLSVRRVDGKPAYSQAVSVEGTRQIHIAGQLARDADGRVVGAGDMTRQLEKVFENLEIALSAAGASLSDVVQTSTFTTDIEAFFGCTDVRMRYLGAVAPTSTTVEVSRLAHPDLLVEISAIAVV